MMDFKAFIITDIVTVGVIILLVVIFAIKISRKNKKKNLDNKCDAMKSILQLFLSAINCEFRQIAFEPLLLEDHDVDDMEVLVDIVEELAYVNADTKNTESVARHAKNLCTCEEYDIYFTTRAMEDMKTLSDIMTDVFWLEKYPLETAISISENSTGNVFACYRTESGESVQHDFKALRYHKGIFIEDGVCCDVCVPDFPEENSIYSFILHESIKDELLKAEIRHRVTHKIASTKSCIIFEYCVDATKGRKHQKRNNKG